MSATNTLPLLSISQLSWQYKQQNILKAINFAIHQGEFIGVIGPNGAGKTSLIHCISQQITEYQGNIHFAEQNCRDINKKDLAKNIAVVMQQPSALFSLSLYQVVRMGLLPHKQMFSLDSLEDKQLIAQALQQVGLANKQDKDFGHLSGGEQQRGLIARALVQRAKLLLLDEPTNHLDVYYQHQIMGLVKSLKLTALMSIHDINLAAMYCDKIMILEQGAIVSFGAVDKVLDETTLQTVFKLPCKIKRCEISNAIQVNFIPTTHQPYKTGVI